MKSIAVFSIHPTTRGIYLMPARTPEDAQRIELMAIREGHVHVEIIDSKTGRKAWIREARDIVRSP
jgi:hypothetical protein